LSSVPPPYAQTAAPGDSIAAGPAADEAVDNDGPAPTVEPTPREKRAITIRLSDEVLAALYRHQAEVRCIPGSRLRDTTIGGVIDTLLRDSLKLPSSR
jgi:hypothetical protein